jgi:hypothetical protein
VDDGFDEARGGTEPKALCSAYHGAAEKPPAEEAIADHVADRRKLSGDVDCRNE